MPVTGVSLSETTASMTVGGDALTLTATVAPENAADQTVTWTTSDASVATVADGVVTAVAAGTATITATATNGTDDTSDDKTATCNVTVTAPATYTVSLADGTDDAANWSTSPNPATAGQTVTIKYNGSKKVKSIKAVKKVAVIRTLAEATAEDLGKIAGADGNIYDTKADAETAGTTAVAMIAYVGSSTDHATYTHGLAIALANESNSNWNTAKSTCEGKSAVTNAAWLLPSQNQWKAMFSANGGNEGNYTGLNNAITTVGGTVLKVSGFYWSSTPKDERNAYRMGLNLNGTASWGTGELSSIRYVRACLAF